MKWIFTLTIYCFLLNQIFSQSIEQKVLSTGGGISSDNRLSWTAGEAIIGGSDQLTQGFHQGNLLITSVMEAEDLRSILLYPNPTHSIIHLEIPDQKLDFQLYSAAGQLIRSGKLEGPHGSLDLRQNIPGLYYIKFFEKGKKPMLFKVEKFQ